jgi:acetyl-CoA acetyltransferase
MDSSDETEVARNLGIARLGFFSRVPYGGGAACGVVMQAAMAVAAGVADVVVC